ncbi:L,D-transpeptidase family protein [Sphingosinicella rhizophila]|uniref:L,D-transpeptidase family protein n=1 Tax=Sphingosinicella rhizophila TaxID=3050082 RepID=UPI0039658488
MKVLGIFVLAAGSLLGSATPPPALLDYDLAGLKEWTMPCRDRPSVRCEVLAGDGELESGASAIAAIPVLAIQPVPDGADDRVTMRAAKLASAGKGAGPAPDRPPAPAPSPPQDPAYVPDTPIISGVRVLVSIPAQKAFVFENGALVATSPVSTGKRGHDTPVGTFRILQKKVRHRSNLYSNAPMPFMQRLTNDGIALHAGDLPGYPASHGCIRMPWSFAKKLYAMTDFQTMVTVTDEHPRSDEEALELI